MSNPLDDLFGEEKPKRPDFVEIKSILDDVFGTPEEQVDTFMGVLKDKEILIDSDEVSRITSLRPEAISIPVFKDQVSQGVRIQHGWHDIDYVWHIAPLDVRRPWKVSLDRVGYAIVKVMAQTIPDTVQVTIWPPMAEWDLPELTFKAFGLREHWSITERAMDDLSEKLFKVLGALV